MAQPSYLTLTAPQIVEAVRSLEREKLVPRTLAAWAAMGVVVPSVQWEQSRGQDRIYSLEDLARCRLVVRLRKRGVSMQRVRGIMVYLGDELRELLRRGTKAELAVDAYGRGVILKRPGHPSQEVPSGQFRLPLGELFDGLAEAAREARKIA